MSHFTPPYPKPMTKHAWALQLLLRPWKFLQWRTCSIRSLSSRAYHMHLGDIRLPFTRIVIPTQPDLVKRVLVDEAEQFPKSQMMADMLETLLGDSIFVSNGDVWRRQRRMMNPAFEQARIKVVFDLMCDAANALFERMDAHANQPQTAIDAEMTHVTADIIFRTIFSRSFEAEEASLIYHAFNAFQEAAYSHGLARTVGLPNWVSWFQRRTAQRTARQIRAVLDPVVKARYDSFHAGEPQTHNDILQSLVSVKDEVTGTHFDLRELCEQVAMLFLAGHETSAASLSWALYLIAMDQEIQERMHREVIEVLGSSEPQFSDIRKLDVSRNVFSEALRLYPPVAFMPRVASRRCTMRDKQIEPGTIVSVSPWVIHRHRRYWDEPDAFIPDRFDDPATLEAQRSCYLPFSRGQRVCLGAAFAQQEAVIILSGLVRRYRFDPVPGFEPKPAGRLTVRSTNGIKLKITHRQQAEAPSSP
ncbi:MAG: cytochrome P450 [Alphaproteobacteria bacterium]|nr:cytochrome P450 [Alphaproteobacteria bacterium]